MYSAWGSRVAGLVIHVFSGLRELKSYTPSGLRSTLLQAQSINP